MQLAPDDIQDLNECMNSVLKRVDKKKFSTASKLSILSMSLVVFCKSLGLPKEKCVSSFSRVWDNVESTMRGL